MIEKFVIQTNDTIWDFLSEIGHSKEVFSYYSFREIDGNTLFFYATSKEIVLICLDIVDDGTAEYAEEGVAWTEPYLRCFTKVLPNGEMSKDYHDKRLSPAMELYTHARDMQRFFATSVKFSLVPAIHLMLLTNSRIVNYPQIVKTWQQKHFGFTALQGLSGLRRGIIYDSRCEGHPFIPVNEDFNIAGSEYWTEWYKYEDRQGKFDSLDD